MKYIILLSALLMVVSCSDINSQKYFNGQIKVIDTDTPCDTLRGEHVKLVDGLYTGHMWAYDTLLGFTYRFPDYFMNVFNSKTGKFLYSLCKRGQKENNFIDITLTDQFVYENPLHLWVRKEGGRKECVLLDLTKPGDIYTKKMDLDVVREFYYPFGFLFVLNDSMFMGNNQGDVLQEGEPFMPPAYHFYNSKTKQKIKTYKPFNTFIPVSKGLHESDYYYSRDRIKPDNSKLAQGMYLVDQINIIDLATGKIKGYRDKRSPDFDYLRFDISDIKVYYVDICVDDTYIYGLYSNTKYNFDDREYSVVKVFDWNGNFIRKIVLDRPALQFTIDAVNKYLYTTVVGEDEEQVYRYKL